MMSTSFVVLAPCFDIFLSCLTYGEEVSLRSSCRQLRAMLKSWRSAVICNIPSITTMKAPQLRIFSFRDVIILPGHSILQLPESVHLRRCFLKTVEHCGWGLFARHTIPKNSIVACYGGEFLSTAEVKRRQSSTYDSEVGT